MSRKDVAIACTMVGVQHGHYHALKEPCDVRDCSVKVIHTERWKSPGKAVLVKDLNSERMCLALYELLFNPGVFCHYLLINDDCAYAYDVFMAETRLTEI